MRKIATSDFLVPIIKTTAVVLVGMFMTLQPLLLGRAKAAVQFDTLPVGATLPSEATCASLVRPTPEVRASKNTTYNARKGVGGNYLYPRVTGNYAGTTDEIIQWAACKWGMNEDLLRAQAVQESSWFQTAMGDFNTNSSMCSPVFPVSNYPAQYYGDVVHNGVCPESVGLLQVRWTYHKSAFFSSTTENTSTMTNNAIYSTAYNVDYYGAIWRDCFDGNMTWLNTVERGATYAAGNATGCQGVWFAGRWLTAPAISYINAVQTTLANRTWETAEFAARTSENPVIQPGTIDQSSPSVTITAPSASQTVSGTTSVSASATDNVGVSSVSFYLDGSTTAFATDTTSPFSVSWNTTTSSNGTHTITAKASDAAGNVGVSSAVSVTVSNVNTDTTAPKTSITSPRAGSTIRGTTTVSANASDNVRVTKVEFLVDGVVKATDTSSPYSFSWNSGTVSKGKHTLQTRAYDATGNVGYSATVSVTVR
jgi:hypothetical protein